MIRLFENEIENMRDLGGYRTIKNLEIKNNKFIRSNVPENLTNETINKLIENNILTVIDLRTKEEIEKKPGVFFNNKKFEYNNIEIKGGGRIPNSPEDVIPSYIEMLEGKDEIYKIFKIIATSKSGIIYYCNAGKDRTGIITALILKLFEIDNEQIIKDYILSGTYLKRMLNEFAKTNSNLLQIITPQSDTMIEVLNYIEIKYNGIENYLKSIGIFESEINKIKVDALSKV